MASYRALLSDRRFLYYFASQISGDSGYAVYAISVIWLALEISGSLFIAGLVLAVEFAIYSLSFAIGPFVDRVRNLRSVLLIGYPLQAALALTLAGLEYAHELTVPGLLVLVVVISFVWDFTWTATNAIPPKIVGPDALFRANGLTSAVSGGNQIAGYAAGAAFDPRGRPRGRGRSVRDPEPRGGGVRGRGERPAGGESRHLVPDRFRRRVEARARGSPAPAPSALVVLRGPGVLLVGAGAPDRPRRVDRVLPSRGELRDPLHGVRDRRRGGRDHAGAAQSPPGISDLNPGSERRSRKVA